MSVMEQRRSVGYVGLPPNLLSRDMHGSPRLFTLLPGFNRSERRWLATMLRTVRRRGGAGADIDGASRCRPRIGGQTKPLADAQDIRVG